MADRAHLVAQRGGSRGVATRLITRLNTINDNEDLELPRKIHELESKLVELQARAVAIEDLDQQIYRKTNADELENEIEATDLVNSVIQDAQHQFQYIIEQLKRDLQLTNPTTAPNVPPSVSTRSSSRPKIALPRFGGEILQWQPFWQAFEAEIHQDACLANINKFNYLVGQLEPSVLITVAGLTPSNDNYPVLVKLLTERFGSVPKITAAYMRALYMLPKPESHLKSLRGFYDSLESYVRGLDALGKPSDSYGDLLVCILLDKLPGDVRKNVARQHDQDEWTLDQLRKALRGEIRVMEAGQSSLPPPHKYQPANYPKQSHSMFNGVVPAKHTIQCAFCDGEHYPTQCTAITTVEERKKVVQLKRLCFNCLSAHHNKRDCSSKSSCKICRSRHHTSLHETKSSTSNNSCKNQGDVPTVAGVHCAISNADAAANPANNSCQLSPFVFLKTAVVKIRTKRAKVEANLLFDEGAQRTWMTKELAKRLDLHPTTQEYLLLSGFSQTSSSPKYYGVVDLVILSSDGLPVSVRAIIIDFLVSPLQDDHRGSLVHLPYLKGLNLAHPIKGEKSFHVDILIGADFYWQFISDEKPIRGMGPTAVNSRVGYLVSGPMESIRVVESNQSINLHITSMDQLDPSYLWSLEMLGIFPHKENAKEAAEYADRCIEFKNGRYIARFPWKVDHPELPVNYSTVQNMTRAIIRRMARDPKMLLQFSTLIDQQLKNKFIERVPDAELSNNCHYIPYHYVKKDSITTPIRIVYNCSCKGWNGVSFNDCVETGAPLHNDQTHILVRFRTHAIGIVADVEKAFHHIELNKSDRDYLRWFWLANSQDPESKLVVYRFRVVPFGAKSSPFILNSVIIRHLEGEQSSTARDMQRSVFVDNIITGCENENQALNYYTQAKEIMRRANLPLQAWGFSSVSLENKLTNLGDLDPSPVSKTLGLSWDRKLDSLNVQSVDLLSHASEKASMRDVLRGVASLYDPLGFYSPLTTSGKIFLQDLHKEKMKLDEVMCSANLERWKEIVSAISKAVQHQLMAQPRHYFPSSSPDRELHVFCDASRRAYGAVAYLQHKGKVAFVIAKSRVAPLKNEKKEGEREISIPEAELMAAFIGTLIAETVLAALELHEFKTQVYLWSDSQIVHFWISKSEGHPCQFITNRVRKIRDFNRRRAATWKYVPTEENPADILSRGCSFSDFRASLLWKKGPSWLSDRKLWPTWSVSQFKKCLTLHLTASFANKTTEVHPESGIATIIDPTKFRWLSLRRTTAQIFRLLENLRLKDPTRESWNRQSLTARELQAAENVWIRYFQEKYFEKELQYLQSDKKAWRPALVSQLDLYLDESRIIRSRGRLQNANMPESAKFPILIPKYSVLAKLIIQSVHEHIFHFGVDSTIAHLTQQYWIPSVRPQVKAICRSCVKCRKDSGPSYRLPDPAPMPADRIKESYPFAVTGVDYSGIIPIRGAEKGMEANAYVLLFTCGVSRSIHFEAVEDMTAASFIDAFKRFTSHHPIPRIIYSDNATTFISASSILVRLFDQPEVAKQLADMKITWKYIPKRAPWYGGWWERLIALTKIALRKMTGRTRLKFIQFQTVLCQIEAILNDRTLTRVPTDIDGLEPLTPSHLLYGRRLTILPFDFAADEEQQDPSYGIKNSVSKAYLRSQNVLRSFWRTWNNIYVPSLREYHQKTKGRMEQTIRVGDVVQVHTDCKRAEWKLAIVQNLIRGKDGLVRAAEIKTANGRTNRPINKLYPIEVVEAPEERNNQPQLIDQTRTGGSPHRLNQLAAERETRLDSVRLQRKAAQQASRNIKHIANLENIDEEE